MLIYSIDHKTQTKMMDCWYACIQMVLTYHRGQREKPRGNALAQHRDIKGVGRRLDFGSHVGGQIMFDNDLVAIGNELDLDDIGESVEDVLRRYGPFIVCGKFNRLKCGHCIVILGVDNIADQIYISDPGWLRGQRAEPLEYLRDINVDGAGNVALQAALAGTPPAAVPAAP